MPNDQNPESYLTEHGSSKFLKDCIENVTANFETKPWRKGKPASCHLPYWWKVPARGLPRVGDKAEKMVFKRLASEELAKYLREPTYIIR